MKNRNIGIDVLRIIACIGVILLHVIGFKNKDLLIIYYLGTISIPIFFMISGYLICKKDLNYKYILNKVINFILFVIIWSIIVSLLIFIHKHEIKFIDILLGTIIQKNLMGILWFMWAICLMYLISPILQKIVLNKKASNIFLLICLAISEIVFFINIYSSLKYDILIVAKCPQILRIWTWITYFYLGMYLNEKKAIVKNCKWGGMLLLIIIMAIYEYLMGTLVMADARAEFFYDSLIVKVVVTYIFYFFTNKTNYNKVNIIERLALLTTGVYPIHFILLTIFNIIIKNDIYYIRLIELIGIVLLSFMICDIANKIPVLKWITQTNYLSFSKKKNEQT